MNDATGHPPITKNWWQRNWMWVVPVGCLSVILLPVACVATLAALTMGMLRSSDVLEEALDRARGHPEVISELGEPIELGLFITGTIHYAGSRGEADLSIPVAGPDGEATIYVVAEKIGGEWEFEYLIIEFDATGKRLDLLEDIVDQMVDTMPSIKPKPSSIVIRPVEWSLRHSEFG